MPSVIGMSCSPDSVGVRPWAICRKIGRKVTAPNSDAPVMKPMAEVTQNTFIRNRPSGRIGSGAARSIRMKATSAATARTPSPTIMGEPQA